MQQTGPRAVLESRILAGAQSKHPLQQVNALAHRRRMGKRAEVAVLLVQGATVKSQPRELRPAQHQVGIGLVIPKQDVVAWCQRFDEVVLKHQSLNLGARDRHLHSGNLRHHHGNPRTQCGPLKVGGDALLQITGLADIQDAVLGIEHAIDTRQPGQIGYKASRVESRACFDGCNRGAVTVRYQDGISLQGRRIRTSPR